jgi:hypothetical protein
MLGMFEAGLFPGVNYYLSWYVVLNSQPLLLSMDAIAGTNARSLVFGPPCSSPQLQSLVHSAGYLRSACRDPSSFSGNILISTTLGCDIEDGRRRGKTSLGMDFQCVTVMIPSKL